MYWRGKLNLNIPIATYNAISATRKNAFRDEVLAMKAYARKINEGQPNEEMTVLATMTTDVSYWYGKLLLAIPWDVWLTIPNARKIAFRDEVLAMKAKTVAIGLDDAVIASWHVCRHDEGKPCEAVQNI